MKIKKKIKLIIWDLDDTFWRGTLAESDVTINSNALMVVRKLNQRGIINTIVSKNDYNTVKNDLDCCKAVIDNNGTVLCDDYDLSYAPGVKQSIDEFVKKHHYKREIICNGRFAKIEK